ncbi:MAG: hypothetical protein ABI882_23815 [Acidobacteriota bacterium]
MDAQLAARAPEIVALEAKAKEAEANAPVNQVLTPEQSRAYWAANGLITRKVFSWTLLLNDIERLIPRGVRVLRVGVSKGAAATQNSDQEAKNVTVPLDMEVVAKGVDDITQMITAFNQTRVFVVTPKWQKPVEGLSDIEFGLEIAYQPPPLTQRAKPAAVRQPAVQQIAERR